MATSKISFNPSEWERVPGAKRKYKNKNTGQIVTRYAFDKMQGIDRKANAEAARKADPVAAAKRPARGRTKIKTATEFDVAIVKARIEKAEADAARKAAERLNRKIQRIVNKQVKVPKRINKGFFPVGKLARRIEFNNYEEYKSLVEQLKKLPYVYSWGHGLVGYSERSDELVYMMASSLSDIVYGKPDFEAEIDDLIENHSYVIPARYFLHIRVTQAFAREKMAKAAAK